MFSVSPCLASPLSGVILPLAIVSVMFRVCPPPPTLRNARTAPIATKITTTAPMTMNRVFLILACSCVSAPGGEHGDRTSSFPRQRLGEDPQARHGIENHQEEHRVPADPRPLRRPAPPARPHVGPGHRDDVADHAQDDRH